METLDEESIIRLLWGGFGAGSHSGAVGDPFNDDAAWVRNSRRKKFLVAKADMMVASTDAPPGMTPEQMARKAVVACVSDLAAKGVKPSYCLVSLGLPKKLANTSFISGIASGFSRAEAEYGLKIIGGDTNSTLEDPIFDCSVFGYSDILIKRSGARIGDLVGVSGKFGYPPAGLLLLMGKAKSSDPYFNDRARQSVLEPQARLDLGLRAARLLSSCIDCSDGLAISLYHLAQSSGVDFELSKAPAGEGLDGFASENSLDPNELVFYGGEEYELVCTFNPRHSLMLSRLGISVIGSVVSRKEEKEGAAPKVTFESSVLPRRGWLHFKS
jgi:thiamine-monophosphate kinase